MAPPIDREPRDLREHEGPQFGGLRAEREPQAELALALRDAEREHGIEADRGKRRR